jgi:hypothetical protein
MAVSARARLPACSAHVEQAIEQRAGRAGLPRERIGLFHLPENLHVPKHERVEARRHPEQVLGHVCARSHVALGAGCEQVAGARPEHRVAEALLGRRDLRRDDVELRPVAGGEQHHFAHDVAAPGLRQQVGRLRLIEGQALARGEARGSVVHAYQQQVHPSLDYLYGTRQAHARVVGASGSRPWPLENAKGDRARVVCR